MEQSVTNMLILSDETLTTIQGGGKKRSKYVFIWS